MISIQTVIAWIFLLTMYPISLRFLTMKQSKLPQDNLSFSKHELETILYSLEGYIQGNNDEELVEELDTICYKLDAILDEEN